jgi:hypothetical protein
MNGPLYRITDSRVSRCWVDDSEGSFIWISRFYRLSYSKCMCGREGGKKEGQWGLGKASKSGAVDSEHGVSKGGDLQLRTKSHNSK